MHKIVWIRRLALVIATISGISAAHADLIFSTQPRGSFEKYGVPFEQVAAYLSKAIGVKVVYQHPRDWISYGQDLRQDKFDIVFDEAHFVAWRMANKKHVLVAAAVPEASERHTVIVRAHNNDVQHIGQLAGRTVCGMSPPNFATLALLNQFSNPLRIPLIISVDSYDAAYRGVVDGKCAAAVLSDVALERLNKGRAMKSIFTGERLMPGDAFTVGPRVSDEVRGKILEALLSADASTSMKTFIERYAFGKLLNLPVEEDYKGLETLLKADYGFSRQK